MLRIFDYTHVMKGSYFLQEGSLVVLVDFDQKLIRASSFVMRFHLLFSRLVIREVRRGTQEYQSLLNKYEYMLADLVLPAKCARSACNQFRQRRTYM